MGPVGPILGASIAALVCPIERERELCLFCLSLPAHTQPLLPPSMSGRQRRPQLPQAEQVINEYLIDRDTKKMTNAITLLDRRFYDSLYPEPNPKESFTEKFGRLLVASDALTQKERLEVYLQDKDIVDS